MLVLKNTEEPRPRDGGRKPQMYNIEQVREVCAESNAQSAFN
jgi:hypothetical protein